MNPRFLFLAFLALLILSLWWLLGMPGCQIAPARCKDRITTLSYGTYCAPQKIRLRDLKAADTESDLPDFCDRADLQQRLIKVAAPDSGRLFMHLYLNFSAKVHVAFIGTNCDGKYQLLNDCGASTQAVVSTYSVATAGFSTVYIQLSYEGLGNYSPGEKTTDELVVAVFDGPPAQFQPLGAKRAASVYSGCGNQTNRIILSPAGGSSTPLEVAIASGLPYQACDCSDGQLVTITAPVGVDINEVKPKIKEKDTKVDTINMTIDRLLPSPRIAQIDSLKDGNEYGLLASNTCLRFRFQPPSNRARKVKVAIIDSGVDAATHASIFDPMRSSSNLLDCVPSNTLGSDLLRADDSPDDEIGHGTAIASVIASSFDSQADLVLMHNKFFGPDGGTLFDAICGAYAAIKAGSQLLNLSWGFESDEEPVALLQMLEFAQQNDVIVVVSTGNDSLDLDSGTVRYWPALAAGKYNTLVAVSAYEGGLAGVPPTLAAWSNFGVNSNAVAAFYTAHTLQLNSSDRAYTYGTSIAAPIVTRKLAELRGNEPDLKAADIVQLFLQNHCQTAAGLAGRVTDKKYLTVPDPTNACKTP